MHDAIKALVILLIGVGSYIVTTGFVMPSVLGMVIVGLIVWGSIGGLYCIGNWWTLWRVPIVVKKHGHTVWMFAFFFGTVLPLILIIIIFFAYGLGFVDTRFL